MNIVRNLVLNSTISVISKLGESMCCYAMHSHRMHVYVSQL